ncbi:MAG TPA: hypothetical protein DCR44_04575 [Acholeplasmatales bacterium]|nr:hypothetical protein [Acholeplasmatales bacterium]
MREKEYRHLDCHIHYALPVDPHELVDIMKRTDTDIANLVIVPHRQRISSVPDALMVKHLFPDRFYVFSSLDVTQYFMHHDSVGQHFVTHVKKMLACGCDGVKMIEGKPDMRRTVPIPDFDHPSWDSFWSYAEASGLPILWHVNDPEEFWDPDRIPAWAKSRGWLYGKETINNEVQYAQVLRVLEHHPGLKIIFAHFFFMSAQLPRLATILDRFPQVCIDLTPGIEMYINLSKNRDETVAFFTRYQDRILYGTDIGARSVLGVQGDHVNLEESLNRSSLIRNFLTEASDFVIKADGNFLIGTEDFVLRGLGLPESILTKIYAENFLRVVGDTPRAVSPRRVIRACRHIKLMIRIMSFIDKKLVPDYSYANQVIAYFHKPDAKQQKIEK